MPLFSFLTSLERRKLVSFVGSQREDHGIARQAKIQTVVSKGLCNMTVRLCKIVMVLSLAFFAFLVTFNNITDYQSNYNFVQHVLSMDTTFKSKATMYRAITSPTMWNAGYLLIILGEGLTCVAFLIAGFQMLSARNAGALEFQRSKKWTAIGATLGFLVWFVGFMGIGGEWFLMWQSEVWNGQQAAFRFYVTILAVLIFVMQLDGDKV